MLHPETITAPRDEVEAKRFPVISAEFFFAKINQLKATITQRLNGQIVNPLRWDRSHTGSRMDHVRAVAVEKVRKLIVSMPVKTSPLDILPTKLLKSCVNTFAPIIAHLANLSFREGRFPKSFKSAQVTPILKKKDLDTSQPQNYRPISNLNTISKILERRFLSRLDEHVKQSPNYSRLQSAYKKYHSTETAMLKILNDIYTAADNGFPTCLVALDLSGAFDTLDHVTLLDRLERIFGLTDSALEWIGSYLTNRSQRVCMNSICSTYHTCPHGRATGKRTLDQSCSVSSWLLWPM